MTQDAGHIFHLFPVTSPSNALWSERDCICANMLWWAFSCIACPHLQRASYTVAVDQVYLCSSLVSWLCTLMNTCIHEQGQQPFRAEAQRP